ncbi:MAG: hypothetical protein AB8F95_10185 [Bacteroidia bacterium]
MTKRQYRIPTREEQLRWLGFVSLVLFVPGGLPIALLVMLRRYRKPRS